jgi:hypothetical protein
MKKKSFRAKIVEAKCDVCEKSIMLDQYGNGDECYNCGWRQSEESREHPDVPAIRNIPSLNNARKLYAQGKPLVADFTDFLGAYDNYGEIEFTYNGTRYTMTYDDDQRCIALRNTKTRSCQYHKTIEAFATNANINGVLLKNLWGGVTNTDFLQGD